MYSRDNKPDISYPNYWNLIGGQIEENETPLQALEREIKEEINCKAKNILFIGKIPIVNNSFDKDHIVFLFKGDIKA